MEWANKSRAIDPNKPHTWNGREASQPRGNLPKSDSAAAHSLRSWRAECAPTASRKWRDSQFAALATHKVAHATTMTAITEILRAIRFISLWCNQNRDERD